MDAKEECTILMNDLLSVTQHFLEKNREFYPVGAVLDENDEIIPTGVFDGNDFPASQDVINMLIKAHKDLAREKRLKVSGIAYNASVMISGKKTDAIIVSLEHSSGYSVTVCQPYKFTLFRKVKYGELFAQQGSHDIFH